MDLSSNRISGQGQSSQRQQGRQAGNVRTGQNTSAPRPSSLSDYGTSRHVSSLYEGEIIKGEISDLRNNEIEVTLENNTHVTAQLEDSSGLSIGDTAAFKVTHIEKGEITLKALPKTPLLQEISTIFKALDEAGLPKNDKNIAIVRELMNEGLAINRQGIQAAIKMTYHYPDISLSTLFQAEKYQLPLHYEQLLMLEDLKNGSLSLPMQLNQFSGQLFELLENESPNSTEFLTLIQLLSGNESKNTAEPDVTGELPFYFSSKDEQLAFLDILSNFQDTNELGEAINQGNLTLRDAVHYIMDSMNQAMNIDENNRKIALMEMEDENTPKTLDSDEEIPEDNVSGDFETRKGMPFFKQFFSIFSQSEKASVSGETNEQLSVPSTLDLFDHPVIHNIMQSYEEQSLADRIIFNLLTPDELSGLANTLSEIFPDSISQELLSKIRYGEISVPEFMKVLREQLKQAPFPLDSETAQEIFDHPVLHKLISKSLFSSSFLAPQDFYDRENIQKSYIRTVSTLNVLEHMLNSRERLLGGLSQSLLNSGAQIKSQLSFLSALDNTLQYLQLPLKLKQQNTKGELYVYTKKQALREHPDSLSVLLHLDMEHLGPLDVALKMESNKVQAVFTVEDSLTEKVTTKEILNSHFDILKSALEEKGFLLTTRFETKEEFTSFSSYLKEQQKGNSMKRYTFDIRA